MTLVPGSSSRLRKFCKQRRADRLNLVVVEVRAKHHVGEDFQRRVEIAGRRVATASDVCIVWAFSAWLTPRLSRAVSSSRLSRGPAPREIHSATMVAAPPPRFSPPAPSYAEPAGRSNENAADWTQGITSATRTSPFGNVCCSIVDEDADKGTSRSPGQRSAVVVRQRMSRSDQHSSRSIIDRLVECLGPAKAYIAIKLNRGNVFRGHLQISLPQSRLMKPRKCPAHQRAPEPEPTVHPQHSYILDRTDCSQVRHALNCTYISRRVQAINHVAPGRKPGFRRISDISRRQP